jgi:hypothetical protein
VGSVREKRLEPIPASVHAGIKRVGKSVDESADMSVAAASTIARLRQLSGVGRIRLYIGSLLACSLIV